MSIYRSLVVVSLAAASVLAVACGGTTDASENAADETDQDLSAAGKRYTGSYVPTAEASLGYRSLQLNTDGTFTALWAPVCPAGQMCPQMIQSETGRWNVKASNTLDPDTLTLRMGRRKEIYEIGHRYGAGMVVRGGINLTQDNVTEMFTFAPAAPTCAVVRCASGTHCEQKGINGGSIPVCIRD